ncbi:Hypothetical_protein [Hexamita inflata]|uniref:Hypothetical_protein n=1 Tax=Hexamita inflata TaxID=28002 RepID=A0AA86UIX2_9EUKA|nr:Hypothetical protein HINF_LOCUS45179 [Hexamita inflata]
MQQKNDKTSPNQSDQISKEQLKKNILNYKLKKQNQNNFFVQQILIVIQDITTCLPENTSFEDIKQLVQKLQSILEYSELQGQYEIRLKHILMLLNTLSNSIIKNCDIKLEISLFCFGDSLLPLPAYQIRNIISKNIQSSFIMFKSIPKSGKTILISGMLAQISSKNKKRFYYSII